jgi:NitT/TauT family transport system substrate-binding protein
MSPAHTSSYHILSAILAASLIIALFAGGCVPAKKELIPVKVRLSWLHTAEFSGLYLAKELGYYEKEGLNVSFEPFDFENDTIDYVSVGNAQFGVSSFSEILISRDKKHLVKAVFALFQKNPNVLISLKASNITKPQDLNGKTIALNCGGNNEVDQIAFLKKYHINYTKACTEYNITQLTDKKVDAVDGFITNEPILYEEAGYAINYLLLAEYGIRDYPNLIFATEDYLEKNPILIEKFLRATEKGIEHSIENHDDAVSATLKYDPTLNTAAQLKTMDAQSPLLFDGTAKIGWIKAESLEQTRQMLVDQNLLNKSANIDEIYTNSFLERIYSSK